MAASKSNASSAPTAPTTTSEVGPQTKHTNPPQQPEAQICHKIQSVSPKPTPSERIVPLEPNQEGSQQDSELTNSINRFFNEQ